MDNKEKFTRDILYHTRNGTMTWKRATPLSAPPYIQKLLNSPASVYVAHSGENDVFSYYIVKIASPTSSDYVFYVYHKNSLSFALQPGEMVEPFTLKALYDTVSYADTEKAVNQGGETIAEPPTTKKQIDVEDNEWKTRALAAEKELQEIKSLLRRFSSLVG